MTYAVLLLQPLVSCDSLISVRHMISIMISIKFNADKSVCMLFQPKCKEMRTRSPPAICLCGAKLSYADTIKYLGVIITNSLKDDLDLQRQTRSLYVTAYSILKKFSACSDMVKNALFRCFCYLYCSHLWSSHTKASLHA